MGVAVPHGVGVGVADARLLPALVGVDVAVGVDVPGSHGVGVTVARREEVGLAVAEADGALVTSGRGVAAGLALTVALGSIVLAAGEGCPGPGEERVVATVGEVWPSMGVAAARVGAVVADGRTLGAPAVVGAGWPVAGRVGVWLLVAGLGVAVLGLGDEAAAFPVGVPAGGAAAAARLPPSLGTSGHSTRAINTRSATTEEDRESLFLI